MLAPHLEHAGWVILSVVMTVGVVSAVSTALEIAAVLEVTDGLALGADVTFVHI